MKLINGLILLGLIGVTPFVYHRIRELLVVAAMMIIAYEMVRYQLQARKVRRVAKEVMTKSVKDWRYWK
jgi:hypothetical protein